MSDNRRMMRNAHTFCIIFTRNTKMKTMLFIHTSIFKLRFLYRRCVSLSGGEITRHLGESMELMYIQNTYVHFIFIAT